MKNYEQMAHDVLKRKDAEIKRRKRAFLIGAPCAAAVLVGVAGIGTAVAASNRRHINSVVAATDSSSAADANSGNAEITDAKNPDSPFKTDTAIDLPETGSIDIAIDHEPYMPDYTNPNSGENDIHVIDIDTINITEHLPMLNIEDFCEYTLESLDSFYGLRFNRLGELYPTWQRSDGNLGVYRRETSDGVIAAMEMYFTRNTLLYTAENGAQISVSAQYGAFMPVSKETFTADKPVSSASETGANTEYDENGSVIGQTVGAYDPERVNCYPDEGASIVNGYEALIYRDANGGFLADIDMNSRVRIAAGGLSEDEFLKVLDDFTK